MLALVLGLTSPVSPAAGRPVAGTAGRLGRHLVGLGFRHRAQPPHRLPDRTIRNVVHTSVGGSGVRVSLTNVLGTVAVRMDVVTVAVAEAPDAPAAVAGTMRALTFGGAPVGDHPGRR